MIFQVLYLVCHFGLSLAFGLYGVVIALATRAVRLFAAVDERRPKLVVVGGGFAGALVAKRVERQFETTLIDSKSYYEFTPSILRVLTEPNHLDKIQVSHSKYLDLHHATVLTNTVTDVAARCVTLASGERLEYDRLVLATGSSYHSPIKEDNDRTVFLASRGDTLTSAHQKLRQSKRVLVIGGGIVGIELAAEIVEHFPHKSVQLIHSGPRLCHSTDTVPKKSSSYCERVLRRMGVTIHFNERIVDREDETGVFKSKAGRVFYADMAFICTGIRPNSSLMKESDFLKDSLDLKGFVKVDKHLRVTGHKNVYCAGDVASLKEEKLAQSAEKQADVIVDNLLAPIDAPASTYKATVRPILISLGRTDGSFFLGSFCFNGFFAALMKEVVEFKVITAYKSRMPVFFSRPRANAKTDSDRTQ